MGEIVFKNICKSFGETKVIENLDLTIKDGEFTVLVGASGCGKTTLLRMIAGIGPATSGELYIDGEEITDVPPGKRGIAMVFQEPMTSLNPTMRIGDQIIEVLMKHFVFTKAEMHQFTDELLESLKTGSREEVIPAWLTEYFRPTGKLLAKILYIGFPSLGRQGIASVSNILLNNTVLACVTPMLQDAAISAISITSRFVMFITSSVIGFGQGFQPFCGFNYGAGLYKRVKEGFYFCVKTSAVFLFVIAAAGFVFAPDIIAVFRDNY